jgi:CRISPR-associated protein Cas2
MKTLKDFGQHVQYSVFECELRREDYLRLRERLKKLVDPQEDNLRFYVLSEEDLKKRKVWGIERAVVDVRPYYLVGGKKQG